MGLVIGLLPLCLGILGSGAIFRMFKKKNGLKFILGTIFSMIMYYIFWYLGIVIIFSIAVIITAFE